MYVFILHQVLLMLTKPMIPEIKVSSHSCDTYTARAVAPTANYRRTWKIRRSIKIFERTFSWSRVDSCQRGLGIMEKQITAHGSIWALATAFRNNRRSSSTSTHERWTRTDHWGENGWLGRMASVSTFRSCFANPFVSTVISDINKLDKNLQKQSPWKCLNRNRSSSEPHFWNWQNVETKCILSMARIYL